MIRRSISREAPRKEPKFTKEQLEERKKMFKPSELWGVKVPADFSGDQIDYLMYQRNE